LVPCQIHSPRRSVSPGKQWQTSCAFRDSSCSAASTTVDPDEAPFDLADASFACRHEAVDDDATSELLSLCDLYSSAHSMAATESASRETSCCGSPACPESATNPKHRGIVNLRHGGMVAHQATQSGDAVEREQPLEPLGASGCSGDSDFFCSAVDLAAARNTWAPGGAHSSWSLGFSTERRCHLATEAHPWCLQRSPR